MSVKPSDPVLERLNYFNGQRLAASDLRTEQGHHVGMRRVLNSSLYSAGVVVGLDVKRLREDDPDPKRKHKVIVSRGLAFDHMGREIFVPGDVPVLVMGAPSKTPGVVFGNLLAVSYRENRRHPSHERCAVVTQYQPCSGDMPWGAPTRITADWVFEFLDSWPAEDSGKIVLAQIELDATCEIERIIPGVRRYAIRTKATVRALALEGEKDIDRANPKILTFHLEGGFPNSATLHLRSRPFSTLHYTELARHTHELNLVLSEHPRVKEHSHLLEEITTKDGLVATDIGFESYVGYTDAQDSAIALSKKRNLDVHNLTFTPLDLFPITSFRAKNTLHKHIIEAGEQTKDDGAVPAYSHTFSKSADETGQTPGYMRTGPAYDYFDELQIWLDGTDITDEVLFQLRTNSYDWPTEKLGKTVAGGAHLMARSGTGPIDLLRIPDVVLAPGQEHTLRFVPQSGGGQLQYNLYVD